jgi:predicted nucleic acid-binding protein
VIVICYFDTSFLAKLYLAEPESDEAFALSAEVANDAAVSLFTDVEMASLLFRRVPAKAVAIHAAYRSNRVSGMYRELSVGNAVLIRARQLAESGVGLKSLDMIQLATAVHHGVPMMAVYDKELRKAAAGMGLKVLPERS